MKALYKKKSTFTNYVNYIKSQQRITKHRSAVEIHNTFKCPSNNFKKQEERKISGHSQCSSVAANAINYTLSE